MSLAILCWVTGFVFSGASLTSWGDGASLALVGDLSSDGVTIKITYRVDVFNESGFIVRSVETGLGR